MTESILVTYVTRYGSTGEVAEFIASALREHALVVDECPLSEVATLTPYRTVVFGAPLYVGKFPADGRNFLNDYAEVLASKPLAIFALGPVSTDPHEMASARTQLDNELTNYPTLQPISTTVFVGKYDPDKFGFFHRLIASLPASPIHGLPATDNRDWEAVRDWADEIALQWVLEQATDVT